MNTRRALIACLLALVVGSYATCEDTHPSAPQPQAPGHDPADRQADPRRQRVAVVTVYIEADFLPGWAYVKVTDENGQWEDNDPSPRGETKRRGQAMAGKTYSQSITYTSGRRLDIFVQVTPSRHGSVGSFCLIDDGAANQSKRQVAGAHFVRCTLTTNR